MKTLMFQFNFVFLHWDYSGPLCNLEGKSILHVETGVALSAFVPVRRSIIGVASNLQLAQKWASMLTLAMLASSVRHQRACCCSGTQLGSESTEVKNTNWTVFKKCSQTLHMYTTLKQSVIKLWKNFDDSRHSVFAVFDRDWLCVASLLS